MMIRLLLLLLISALPFPVQAGIVVLNGLSHIYKVENGKVYKGKIAIENNGEQSRNVKLFLQDFSYRADGTSHYQTPHNNARSNAQWIRMNTNLVTLKAKEKAEVYYEILIPGSGTAPGSYWSVIMVEPEEDINPDENTSGISITSVIRYAVQIITDLHADQAKPDLKFEGIKIEKEGVGQFLHIAVANNGNLYCKPAITVDLYHRKTGVKAGSFSSQASGLLPQNSKSFAVDLGEIPPSTYSAVLMATDEDENTFALTMELEIKK